MLFSSLKFNSIAAAALILIAASSSTFVVSFQYQPRRSPTITTLVDGRSMTTNTFQQHRPVSFTTTSVLHSENPNNTPGSEEEILDVGEEKLVGEVYEGSIDWDAEWKKVVENRDQPAKRPGKYKSQVEIAATKATNKVAKNVYDASKDMKANMPSMPNIRSLQGDWRFWIGMIMIVSFGLSILSVTSSGSTSVNESFYI
ncbi:hypothetical protein ACHAXH_002235 [Discostella pseudostelligera]|jgi:hypothetical protein